MQAENYECETYAPPPPLTDAPHPQSAAPPGPVAPRPAGVPTGADDGPAADDDGVL